MKLMGAKVISALVVSVAVGIIPASADVAEGSIGSGKAIQSRSAEHSKPGVVEMRKAPGRSGRAAKDTRSSVEDYATIRRGKNGEVTTVPPSEALKESLHGDRRAELSETSETATLPDTTEEGRAVIGVDDRVQLQDSFSYPFSATGLMVINFEDGKGPYGCSAALVGPSTLITAAHCIYDHELKEPWAEKITFWAGSNGDDIDLGPTVSTDFEILNGYITNWDGTHNSVWQYDVALIKLDDPIGEDFGWFSTNVASRKKGFDGHLVAYHSDRPSSTMWRSKCRVNPAEISEIDMLHKCDALGDVSTGAPLYVFHGDNKARQLVGIHEGREDDNWNWAMRIDDTIATWISDVSE